MVRRRRIAVQLALLPQLLLLLLSDMAIVPTTECPASTDWHLGQSTGSDEPPSLVQLLNKGEGQTVTIQTGSGSSGNDAVSWIAPTGRSTFASTVTGGGRVRSSSASAAGGGTTPWRWPTATTRAPTATQTHRADEPLRCYPEPSQECGRATLPIPLGSGKECTAVCDCDARRWSWERHAAECMSLLSGAGLDAQLYAGEPTEGFAGDAANIVRHPVCGTLTVVRASDESMCMLACEKLPHDMVRYWLYSDSPGANDCFGMAG